MAISASSNELKTIALLGGTFDPIHNGHLQSALELKQRLLLDELRLVPSCQPPHRQSNPEMSRHRLAMVELAAKQTGLIVDDREYQRQGLSYSVETLTQLRQELGQQVSLIWVVGSDAFAHFDQWHRWQDFLGLAHIVVIARPNESLPVTGAVAQLLESHKAKNRQQLKQRSAGTIWLEALSQYSISATAIRHAVKNNGSIDGLLPESVRHYVQQHRLYKS
jgi:nicotinate-nucleotide adenylyltransferase